MGRKLHYIGGSFYRVDDRTGFPQRAERTRKEWTGLIVDEGVFEARQPQDLVRGVKDQQNVPEARPDAPPQYVGPIYQQTAADAVVGQTVLDMQSVTGFTVGNTINVMLDSGVNFTTTLQAIGAGTLELAAGLPYRAAAGNLVSDISYNPTNPFNPNGD